MSGRRPVAALLAACALVAAGCGVGAGEEVGGVTLLVTEDFGRTPVPGSPRVIDAPGGETAMRALQRSFDVTTRFGGGFVQSIDGRAGGREAGRRVDWFFYLNGVDLKKGASSVKLRRGDVVWWDRHDWGAAMGVPAVVGAFPEPFRRGLEGRRIPVRVQCAESAQTPCDVVAERLSAAGVIPGRALLGTKTGQELLRILVGPWPELRSDFAARMLELGPGRSGVYARPAQDGRSIALLDERARVTRRLGPGTGLIAATAEADNRPTWIITGTDAAGLEMAARNLTEDALRRKFAVAVRDDLPIALPEPRAP